MVKDGNIRKDFIKIPREIWEKDEDITMLQLAVLSEITSLSLKLGYCFKDKGELALYFKIREQSITDMINKFKKKGYLTVESKEIKGKKRKVFVPSAYLMELLRPTNTSYKESQSKSKQTNQKYDVAALIKKMEIEAKEEYGFEMDF